MEALITSHAATCQTCKAGQRCHVSVGYSLALATIKRERQLGYASDPVIK